MSSFNLEYIFMYGNTVPNSGTVADVALEGVVPVTAEKLNPPAADVGVGAAPPISVGADAVVPSAGVDPKTRPAAGAVGAEAFPPKLNPPADGAAETAAVAAVCGAPKGGAAGAAADAPNVNPPPPVVAGAAAVPLKPAPDAGAPKLNTIAARGAVVYWYSEEADTMVRHLNNRL
jgi:hypothetical protein